MSAMSNRPHFDASIAHMLDELVAAEPVQSNCMFQLSLMLARIAIEPCSETYKEETAQALLALIRAKPKSNIVSLFSFGAARPAEPAVRTSSAQ